MPLSPACGMTMLFHFCAAPLLFCIAKHRQGSSTPQLGISKCLTAAARRLIMSTRTAAEYPDADTFKHWQGVRIPAAGSSCHINSRAAAHKPPTGTFNRWQGMRIAAEGSWQNIKSREAAQKQDASTLCRCQGYRVPATGSWYNICNSPGSPPAPAPPVRCPMLPVCCSGPRLALCCCANDRNNQARMKHATPFPQSVVCGCTQAVDNKPQGSSRTARCGHISPLARHAHPSCRQVVQRE